MVQDFSFCGFRRLRYHGGLLDGAVFHAIKEAYRQALEFLV